MKTVQGFKKILCHDCSLNVVVISCMCVLYVYACVYCV